MQSTAYYKPTEVSETDLELMRRIDELHMEFVCAGSRKLCSLLKREGYGIGRRHVRTLMKRMGIEALYSKPHTSRRTKGTQIYPYLLRGVEICHSNHVWAGDIYVSPPDTLFQKCLVRDKMGRKQLKQNSVHGQGLDIFVLERECSHQHEKFGTR